MEVDPTVQVLHPALVQTPDGLRQQQRDQLSPQACVPRTSPISTTFREVEGSAPKSGITLAPAPRFKVATGMRSPDLIRKRQIQEGLRKENSVTRRAKREAEDGKHDITPDGGSAAREGRQFTVANVGNNGRIYLRYSHDANAAMTSLVIPWKEDTF